MIDERSRSKPQPPDRGFEGGDAAGDDAPGGDRDTIVELANMALRHRWWIIVSAVLLASATVTVKLLTPRTYTSRAKFVPETARSGASDLAGLAAQFGVNVSSSNDSYSSQFYIDLVMSDVILRQAVDHPYTFPGPDGGTVTKTLTQVYDIELATPEASRELAVITLRGDVTPTLAVKTGVVDLDVRAMNPVLAQQVAQRLLDLLNEFNVKTRRTRAANERRFVEDRLKAIDSSLRASESRVEDFIRGNREFRRSPSLTFDYERQMSSVSMERQMQASVATALEKAKIDEIRDSPVLTTVQAPIVPPFPNGRGTARAGVLAMIVGGLLGLGFAVLREQIKLRLSRDSAEVAEFRSLAKGLLRTR